VIYVFNNDLWEFDRPLGWRYYKSCTQNFRHLQVRDIHLAPKTFVLYNSSRLSAIDFLCPLFRDIHVAHKHKQNPFKLEPDFLGLLDCPQVDRLADCQILISIYIFTSGTRPTTVPFNTWPNISPWRPNLALSHSYPACSVIYILHPTLLSYTFCTQQFRDKR
jgi:hypothetical protein